MSAAKLETTIQNEGLNPSSNPSRSHQISLDLLRALAILLVLGRHSFSSGLWRWIGWSGVDLFFVISGFLVSGLIFSELKSTGDVKLGRFLIRRALKIYPSFYLFIGISLMAGIATGKGFEYSQILSELFYLQSYIDGMWMHTWSLAVEEHFYLVFALVVALWQSRGFPIYPQRTWITLCGMLLLGMAMRFAYCWPHRNELSFDFTATHLRADGIWMGVILGYAYHFGNLEAGLIRWRWIFGVLFFFGSMALLRWPAGSFEMNAVGLSIVNLGYVGLLCLGLGMEKLLQWILLKGGIVSVWMRWVALIGRHSYSIYLWHLLADNVLSKLGLFAAMGWRDGETASGISTIVFAVVLGMTMGKLVEAPILRWRNRKWA
jgi:peptidoglycan/LPS O-acetylase OafA/YrhL